MNDVSYAHAESTARHWDAFGRETPLAQCVSRPDRRGARALKRVNRARLRLRDIAVMGNRDMRGATFAYPGLLVQFGQENRDMWEMAAHIPVCSTRAAEKPEMCMPRPRAREGLRLRSPPGSASAEGASRKSVPLSRRIGSERQLGFRLIGIRSTT